MKQRLGSKLTTNRSFRNVSEQNVVLAQEINWFRLTGHIDEDDRNDDIYSTTKPS
jgi:hypothetical protein